MPWLWYEHMEIVETILGEIGSMMGPVAGIMLVDFYFVRRRQYDVPSLFTESEQGRYNFSNGWNPRALIAFAVGSSLALSGLIIPALSSLYSFNWFIGIASAGLLYFVLMSRERALPPVTEQQFDDVGYGAFEEKPVTS